MQKKTKYIIAAGVLVAAGVGLSIVLGKGKTVEDVGKKPDPDANGNIPPIDGTQSQSVESQTQGGNNEIQVGDYITPYNGYVNLRDTMEINNGAWWNNLYTGGQINLSGKIFSPDIVGQVVEINKVADKTWYKVDVSAAVAGENDSMSLVNMFNAQDQSQFGFRAYVRASTCDEVDSEGVCIGVDIPTVKKV